jgi:hypothetical protein
MTRTTTPITGPNVEGPTTILHLWVQTKKVLTPAIALMNTLSTRLDTNSFCSPWIRSGDDLFDTNVDEHYDATERFENDKNKSQGQLKDILDLLQVEFQQQALHQRWLQ